MKKIVNALSILAIVFTAIQGVIPEMPIHDTTIVSAVVMFLVTAFTIWKQALSKEIDNKALKATIIVAAIATLGGLNELFKAFPLSESVSQWLRFIVTSVIAVLNLLSKVLWPTPQTKSTI